MCLVLSNVCACYYKALSTCTYAHICVIYIDCMFSLFHTKKCVLSISNPIDASNIQFHIIIIVRN